MNVPRAIHGWRAVRAPVFVISLLTLRGASGGCEPIWQLLMSTAWYKRQL
jgi:hypothetical protein